MWGFVGKTCGFCWIGSIGLDVDFSCIVCGMWSCLVCCVSHGFVLCSACSDGGGSYVRGMFAS